MKPAGDHRQGRQGDDDPRAIDEEPPAGTQAAFRLPPRSGHRTRGLRDPLSSMWSRSSAYWPPSALPKNQKL